MFAIKYQVSTKSNILYSYLDLPDLIESAITLILKTKLIEQNLLKNLSSLNSFTLPVHYLTLFYKLLATPPSSPSHPLC